MARARQGPQASAPGQGTQANALMQIKSAIDMIQGAIPGLPTGSEIHRDALRAVTQLSRHMPQGIPSAGVQQTQLQNMLRNTMRNALLQRVMAQQGGGPGGPPGAMAPSTPTPGA